MLLFLSPRYSPGSSFGGSLSWRNRKFFGLILFSVMVLRVSIVRPELFSLVVFPYVLLLVSWLYLRQVKNKFQVVSRNFPEICREGDWIKVQIKFKFCGDLPVFYLLVRDGFSGTDILEGPELMVFPLIGQDEFFISYEVPANRGFGDFEIGPLFLKVFDPFEIFEEEVIVGGKVPLKVILNPPPLAIDLKKENSLTPLGDSRAQKPGQSLEFYGLSEFRRHDIRFISWAKLAQTGRLIVKEFEFDARADIILVVNTEADKIKGLGFGSNIKRALKVAAGVWEEVWEAGMRLRLIVSSGSEIHVFHLQPSHSDLLFGLEFLAQVKGSSQVDLPTLLQIASSLVSPSTILFVVSHSLDFDLDKVLGHLLGIKAKRAAAHLFTVDDREMVKFSDNQSFAISTKDLETRLIEIGIGFRIIKSEKPGVTGNHER